jgi:PEP-CTERM motif
MKIFSTSAAALAASLLVGTAHAGPFILAGTDADDHGSATAAANSDGWLFMQKALESLVSSTSLTTTNKVVVSLGSDAGTQAGQAAQSAFDKSSLGAAGWTFLQVSSLTAANFASSIAGAGILMFDSGGNVFGGLTTAEDAVLTANAAAIDSFVGAGGGLFSQAGAYGWLSALVPGLVVNTLQDVGLTLTGAGMAAFPGLTDADLSAGPYHKNFTSIGTIPVLATGEAGALNVIIGAAGGSITDPMPAVPEPSTYMLMALGLAGVGFAARRRRPA